MNVTVYKRPSNDCAKGCANRAYSKCRRRLRMEGSASTDAEVRAVASVYRGFSKRGRFRLTANTRNMEDAKELGAV